MKIKHTAEMELDNKMPMAVFIDFFSRIPEDATINTVIHHIAADRPWESASTTVVLQAEWGL